MPDSAVPVKDVGTQADIDDMKRSGRKQDTRRSYNRFQMFGFGCTLIATAEVYLASFQLGLNNGGTAGLFWGFVVVVIVLCLVYMSLSEMASMQPTAGGQYEWTSLLAAEGSQKYLSYVVGWLCVIGWQSGVTAIAFLISNLIQGLIALTHPDYVLAQWHGTLLAIGVVSFAAAVNIYAPARVPQIEGVVAIARSVGIAAILIVLWVLAPKNNAHDAFLQFRNDSGWSLDGQAFVVGLPNLALSLLGFDSMVHMSEETKSASKNIPHSIMSSYFVNVVLGAFTIVTIIFTCGDVDKILHSPYGLPIIDILYSATNSIPATVIMVLILVMPLFASEIAVVATASRQFRGFSRDLGPPFANCTGFIHPKAHIPINAIVATWVGSTSLSLVNLGSSTAVNAFFSLNVGCLFGSYKVSIGCMIRKRIRGEVLPDSQWSLGRWGKYINMAALCSLAPIFVFAMFPIGLPVESDNMNWGSLMFGAVIVLSTALYLLHGRSNYTSPRQRQNPDESVLSAL